MAQERLEEPSLGFQTTALAKYPQTYQRAFQDSQQFLVAPMFTEPPDRLRLIAQD